MINTPAASIQQPARIISEVWRRCVPNTMVLGAVATGSIKPKEAAKVAGNISNMGSICIEVAIAAKIGNANCILATLEANSLNTATNSPIAGMISQSGAPCKKPSWLASQVPKPDTSKPFASANPLPNNRIMPKGKRLASSHSSRLRPACWRRDKKQ